MCMSLVYFFHLDNILKKNNYKINRKTAVNKIHIYWYKFTTKEITLKKEIKIYQAGQGE
jgi:hypothetical protein